MSWRRCTEFQRSFFCQLPHFYWMFLMTSSPTPHRFSFSQGCSFLLPLDTSLCWILLVHMLGLINLTSIHLILRFSPVCAKVFKDFSVNWVILSTITISYKMLGRQNFLCQQKPSKRSHKALATSASLIECMFSIVIQLPRVDWQQDFVSGWVMLKIISDQSLEGFIGLPNVFLTLSTDSFNHGWGLDVIRFIRDWIWNPAPGTQLI